MGLTYVPEERLSIWLRQILSVALSNFVMAKLGVACPPASAHSLIYAEGKHDWEFWGLAMLGCVVSFIPAIFFNNLNPRRQYPSYWGYAPARVYRHAMEETNKDTKKDIQVTGTTENDTEQEVKHVTKVTREGAKKEGEVTEETENNSVDAVKHAVQIPSGSSH